MTEQLNESLQAMDLTTKPVEDGTVAGAKEDFVDPWNVTSTSDKGIDYEKLISKLANLKDFQHIINCCSFF